MIEVNIPLFGMPSLELDIAGQEVTEPDIFRLKGLELLDRLDRVAEMIEAMKNDGWSIVGEVFNLSAYHEKISNIVDAEQRLMRLGIESDEVFVTECEECYDES